MNTALPIRYACRSLRFRNAAQMIQRHGLVAVHYGSVYDHTEMRYRPLIVIGLGPRGFMGHFTIRVPAVVCWNWDDRGIPGLVNRRGYFYTDKSRNLHDLDMRLIGHFSVPTYSAPELGRHSGTFRTRVPIPQDWFQRVKEAHESR